MNAVVIETKDYLFTTFGVSFSKVLSSNIEFIKDSDTFYNHLLAIQ